jgi:hypothetical protein
MREPIRSVPGFGGRRRIADRYRNVPMDDWHSRGNSRPVSTARRKSAALKKSNDQAMKRNNQIICRWARVPLDNVERIGPVRSNWQVERGKSEISERRVMIQRSRSNGRRNNHIHHRLSTMMASQACARDWQRIVIGGTAASQTFARTASASATLSAAHATSRPAMTVANRLKVTRAAAARKCVTVQQDHRQHQAHHRQMAMTADKPN